MCEKLYENNKVHAYRTNYIYCSICDSLVFISDTSFSTHIYQDNHLKRCISGNSILKEYAKRKEISNLLIEENIKFGNTNNTYSIMGRDENKVSSTGAFIPIYSTFRKG